MAKGNKPQKNDKKNKKPKSKKVGSKVKKAPAFGRSNSAFDSDNDGM